MSKNVQQGREKPPKCFDINSNFEGITPLIWAVLLLNYELVELLVNRGANLNATVRDYQGRLVPPLPPDLPHIDANELTPLGLAKYSLKNMTRIEPMLSGKWVAIREEEKKTLENIVNLLENPPKVVYNCSWNKELHKAAKEGKAEEIKTLLENNVYVNPRNLRHNTPLHLAARRGHNEVVKYLLNST